MSDGCSRTFWKTSGKLWTPTMGRYYGVVARSSFPCQLEANPVEKVKFKIFLEFFIYQRHYHLVISKSKRRHSMNGVLPFICLTCIL